MNRALPGCPNNRVGAPYSTGPRGEGPTAPFPFPRPDPRFFWMTLTWSVVFLVLAFQASAGVLNYNAQGQLQRWNLTAPDGSVHTNVVNIKTHAVRYFLASDGWSDTNTVAELNAIRVSFDQWQAVPGLQLKCEDAGLVAPGVDINTSDNTNVIFWAKNSTLVNGGFDNIGGALGYTFTGFFSEDNMLYEADIVLNGVDYTWFTDRVHPSANGYSVEGVAMHEIGHFLGIEHSPVGGATLFARGGKGLNLQAGLSADDIQAIRTLYPAVATSRSWGGVRGQVRRNATGIMGAVIMVEDLTGNLIAGTVSRANGIYELPSLAPGPYQLRVTPLDPFSGSLVSADDISPDYGNAVIDFLPTSPQALVIAAGKTNTVNLAVTNGTPAFRITKIRPVTDNPGFSYGNAPTSIGVGQSNLLVGVYGPTLPTRDATLMVSGDGITLGPPQFDPGAFSGLNLISATISIASNATPGLRSFAVQQGSDIAYANGFLEILPAVPDYNFDGLDDNFQRTYFPRFTAPEAAPTADPDGDGFNNYAEYVSGTNPTNAASFLNIESVKVTAAGSTVAWQGQAGKHYQVHSRNNIAKSTWVLAGKDFTSTNDLVQWLDPAVTNSFRFYRVRALP